MRKTILRVGAAIAAVLIVAVVVWLVYIRLNSSGTSSATTRSQPTSQITRSSQQGSQLQTVDYNIEYDGKTYDKNVVVYVPDAYKQGTPMNILYLMHGSTGSGEQTAQAMQPLFDQWIAQGQMEPMLVAFPTYYPDRSFVVSNYSADYPLNHFFATTEVQTVMQKVESQFTTYASETTDQSFEDSRMHRAFGGYSMGGITTWDVLVDQSQYFGYYMPMAGDSWIGQTTGNSSTNEVADTLVSGLEKNGYTPNDFKIIAMVGENDGTKSSMIPQINALRREHSNVINDNNLIYWENDNGGHSQESFEIETEHGMQYLFK
ncbi:alpha/beta hydrolase [Alloscardovia theropitheci]|nr:alpha/beta hydrolase-fold protein [Alloscardovia theropitheci]